MQMGVGSRLRVRSVAIGLMVAQVAALVPLGGAVLVRASDDVQPEPLAVYARAASAMAPDAQAVLAVAVHNPGEATLAGPITLSLHGLPAGMTLLGATTDLYGRAWDCSGSTCELESTDPSVPAELEDGEVASTRVVLSAIDTANLPESADIDVVVSAGPVVASASVRLARLAQGLAGMIDVTDDVPALIEGREASTTITVTNLGPARLQAPVVVTGALPPGATGWEVGGSDWACADTATGPTCTWDGGGTIGVGGAVEPLELTFESPAAAGDQTITWTREVRAAPAGGGADIVWSAEIGQPVLAAAPPEVHVVASATGVAAVTRGGKVGVTVSVAGTGLDQPDRDVVITTPLPSGWTLDTGGNAAWACAAPDGPPRRVTCSRSADFGGEPSSSVDLVLAVDGTATTGPTTLDVEAVVTGPDAFAPVIDSVTIEVAGTGAAVARVRFWHEADGAAELVEDGSPLVVTRGAPTFVGIDVLNVGSGPIPPGAELTLGLQLPAGSEVIAPGDGGAWTCEELTPEASLACTATVTEAVPIASATPRLNLRVTVPDEIGAVGSWPLELAGQVEGDVAPALSAETALAVSYTDPVDDSPRLVLDIETVRLPRAGGRSGLLQVTAGNTGTEPVGVGSTVWVDLPIRITGRERSLLRPPLGCRHIDRQGVLGIECLVSEPIAPGSMGRTWTLPIEAPPGVDSVRVPATFTAEGHHPITVVTTMTVLPALAAHAVAAPSVVVVPDSGEPQVVQLDGRDSVSDGAQASWSQVITGQTPVVAFTDLDPEESADGLVASFTAPAVTRETTLRFRLTITDGDTTSTATVSVVVEPPSAPEGDVPIGKPGKPGKPDKPGKPQSLGRAQGVKGLTASSGSGPWTWATPPTFSLNDLGHVDEDGVAVPVWGSRVRMLDDGDYVWNGPGPEPADTAVTVAWEVCYEVYSDDDPETTIEQCDPADPNDGWSLSSDGRAFRVPRNHAAVWATVSISGSDGDGSTIATTQRYPLGAVASLSDVGPEASLLAPPAIVGTLSEGSVLTMYPGEWTIEFIKRLEWLRCADATVENCVVVQEGEIEPPPWHTFSYGDTYEVTPADLEPGVRLRLRVTAYAMRWGSPTAPTVVSSALSAGATVTCGSQCYEWWVAPAIDRDGSLGPVPITGLPATVVDDGAYVWTDATAAPSSVESTVDWFECDPGSPASCVPVGSGRSHTPATPGVLLEARLTLSGSFAEDGSVRTGSTTVPFGEVFDASAPPLAVTPPSISGTTYVGDTLTATPGEWIGAADATRSYQWLRCALDNPNSCTPIPGATSSTYVVQPDDLTASVSVARVEVTAPGHAQPGTARSGSSAPLTGYEKRLIAPPGIDVGEDGPRVGVAASVVPAVWSAMPATVSGPTYAWQRCETPEPSSCSGPMADGTGATYVVPDILEGLYLRVVSLIEGEALPSGSILVSAPSAIVGPIQQEIVPVTVETDLPGGSTSVANLTPVTVVGSATGFGLITYTWEQTAGPAVVAGPVEGPTLSIVTPTTGTGVLGFRLTVVDGRGNAASTVISIEYGGAGAPDELCQLAATAGAAGVQVVEFGSIQVVYTSAAVSGPGCDADTEVTFASASITAWGWLSIIPATLTATANGLTIQGGTVNLTTGSPLDSSGWGLPAGASLTVGFEPADGTYELVGALVGSTLPGLLGLPSPWTGASRLALSSADGEQAISLSARAWDGSFGAATPVPGQLPEPPEGAPVVELHGSVSTDRSFEISVSAADLVRIGGASIDIAGSVSRAGAGEPTVFAASGELTAPVSLAAGITLDAAALAWDGEAITGEGALTVTVGGDDLGVSLAFSFTNPRSWFATASVAAGGTWSPVPGLDLVDPSVTGHVLRNGEGTSFNLTIGAGAVHIAEGVTLASPSLRLLGACPTGGSCSFELSVTTGVTVSMFGGSLTGSLSGTLNTSTGAFSVTASLGGLTITNGLSFTTSLLRIERSDEGLSVELSSRVAVLGATLDLLVTYDDEGAFVLVELGSWQPFPGAPTLDDAWLVYSSYDTIVQHGDDLVEVPANVLWLSARAGLPSWFTDLVGDDGASARVDGFIGLSPVSFHFVLSFDLGDVEVFEVAGVSLRVTQVGLTFSADGASVHAEVFADGTLSIPEVGGGAPTLSAARLGLYFQPTTGSVGGSVSVVSPGAGQPAISSAFGVPGLDIESLSVSVGIGAFGPQLGLAGAVLLPAAWGQHIGVLPGARVTLAAALAGPASCFGVELSSVDGASNVIDVGRLGALTARHASLFIAPQGCTVGVTTIEPGIALRFDGAIFGVPVQVSLDINPTPLAVSATVTVGDITLGGLTVKDVMLAVDITTTSRSLEFHGAATVFGVMAEVEGAFTSENGAMAVDFRGTFSSPRLGGFQLNDLTVDFSYTSVPQHLDITATLSVDLLGQTQTVEIDVEIDNGVVIRATGTANVSITVGELTIEGVGEFEFRTGEFPVISIDGSATVDGRSLTKVSGRLGPGSLELSAELGLGGVFRSPPQLSGFVAWQSGASHPLPMIQDTDGELVQAQPGDFRFDARNLGVDVAGFGLNVDVLVGRVGGTFFADLATRFHLGFDWADAAVEVRGSFDSNGNFSLDGDAAVTIGGLPAVGLIFTVARQDGDMSLTARGTMNIPQFASVEVFGAFEHSGTWGTLYELGGEVRLRGGQYDFGAGRFRVYRAVTNYGVVSGMEAAGMVNVPNAIRGEVTAAIFSNGDFQFTGQVRTQGTLNTMLFGGAGGLAATASFRKQGTNTTLTFSVSVNGALKVPGSFTLAGSVSSNGLFVISAKVGVGPYSGSTDLGVCTARYSASVTLAVSVIGGSLGVGASVDGTGNVRAWCGEVGAGIGLGVSFSYTPPSEFSLSVRLRLSFSGIGTWSPTLYRA